MAAYGYNEESQNPLRGCQKNSKFKTIIIFYQLEEFYFSGFILRVKLIVFKERNILSTSWQAVLPKFNNNKMYP